MTVVYVTDFAVGSDTALPSYTGGTPASTWASVRNGSSLYIPAARDRVESVLSGDDAHCFVDFTGCPTGDQKISGTVGVQTGYDAGMLLVRASSNNCYQCIRGSASVWELYRVDSGSYTLIQSISVSTTNGVDQPTALKAVGTGATVTITATIAGADQTPFADTSGSRKTSGRPGVGVYANTASSSQWVDDISVDDLISGITADASDTISFSDSGVSVTTRLATASDTNTPTDSAVSISARLAAAADTNTPTDSAVSTSTRLAVASDTNTPSDSATAENAFIAVAADTLSLSDSAVSTTDRVATASDANTPSDSAVSTSDRVAAASDTNTPSDSAVSVSERPAAADDTIAFSDSADALVAIPTDAADTVSFSDSAVSVSERGAAASDSLSLGDSAVSVSERVASAEDTLSLTDEVEGSLAGGSDAEDTVAFDDSAVSVSERSAAAEDALALSDSAVSISERNAAAEDALALSDSAIAGVQPAAVAEDTVHFSDEGAAVLVPPSAGGGRAWLRTLLQERYTREFEEYARRRREEADAGAPRLAPISKVPPPATPKEPAKARETTSRQARELTQVLRTLVREARAPQTAIFELPAPTNVDQVRAVAAPSPDFTAEDEETILHVAQMLNL